MYVGEKIVPIKLDLCVNHTLVKDQFLWDLDNFESDHEEFAKISTRTRALNIPSQLLPLLSDSSFMRLQFKVWFQQEKPE
ncbi:chromatin structure-remodeling complex protein BSH [Glycine max]|uniref:chromatin structure-remodeling complex protein BSH n=1 Tax=Glycine max TaxID=3847 RepID=UPI001B356028|nr:chromatin structure-remodeling complex protein BSH-like [Glycine max]